MPDSIKLHIDSSLYILKQKSLYANRVNWSEIEKQVYDSAGSAKDKSQTFPALKIAFDALGDTHAAYYQFEDQYRLPNPELMLRYSDSIKAAWSRGPRVVGQMHGGIAYLLVPYIGAGKQSEIDRLANIIYDKVTELQNNNPTAWIIDLRLNGGGNIRPMMAGLARFFQDGVLSYCIDRNGKATDEAAFQNGDYVIDGLVQATINKKQSEKISSKVAVLIGAGTASSGEGVAAVFHDRKKTKLFGEQSAGLANSTEGFVFNNEQSYYLISTAYLGSKKKKALPEFVKPDILVKGNDAFSDLSKDLVVATAVRWLTE